MELTSELLPGPGKDIAELYGYPANDRSSDALRARRERASPFLRGSCTKLDHTGVSTGVCSVYNPREREETIICPNRLYFNNYHVLEEVIEDAFGPRFGLLRPEDVGAVVHDGRKVVALGHNFGKEVRIPLPVSPARRRAGSFYTDWILAQIGAGGALGKFVGVEVQSIDITGNYRDAQAAYMKADPTPPSSGHGLNWENVNKRILPQLIFKGRVLQRETGCERGLYFIVPEPVYKRILQRLGGELEEYPPGRGAVTFFRYAISESAEAGRIRTVERAGFTRTNVDSLAARFSGGRDLPPLGEVERRIREALGI
jgi:hypothetical protein